MKEKRFSSRKRIKAWLKTLVCTLVLAPLFSLVAAPVVKGLLLLSSRPQISSEQFFSTLRGSDSTPSKGKGKKIILEHADSLLFDKELLPDVNRLIGHVALRHESWLMQCDSAYLNEADNSFEAFDHIHIQDDTLSILGQYLFYDGRAKFAQLRRTVELSNKTATLYTDSLDYDRKEGKGYYFDGGTLVDSLNTLSSLYGEYVPATNEAFFENNVVLENPDYTLYTDRLRYNTETKIAYFDGTTTIVSDSGKIESTRGIYDTERDVAILLDKSIIHHKQGDMVGDSLLYDRRNGIAEAFGNMVLNDTINKMVLRSDYGYFVEDKEYAFATVYAYLEDYSRKDTLYIGADTLEMISQKETSSSQEKDPIRLLLAYHRAKIYRKDMQGVADSLSYFTHDSILSLYQKPIVWSDSVQLEGDTLRAYFADDTLHHATSWYNAKAMRQLKDSTLHDQVKCDSMLAFFADQTVSELRAFREVQMVYFPLQESINRYFGVGNLKSPKSYIYFHADTLERAISFGPVEGALHPIEKATNAEKVLPGFVWEPQVRPHAPSDVVCPLLDSLGNPLPFRPVPIVDLSRFDGSFAALAAYETITREIRLSQERAKHLAEQKKEERRKQEATLPQYIRRPKAGDKPYQPPFNLEKFFHTEWPYLQKQTNPENSTIPPSITIPERLPSNEEQRRYETNS